MIYIDPPYNTGNESFVYPDKFSETRADYEKRVGDKDEEGYMTKDGMFKKNSKEKQRKQVHLLLTFTSLAPTSR